MRAPDADGHAGIIARHAFEQRRHPSDMQRGNDSEIDVSGEQMAELYENDTMSSRAVQDLPINTSLVIHSERGSALGRVSGKGQFKVVRGDRDVFGLHGRSAEQRLAIDLLLDPEVGIISLGGRAAGRWRAAAPRCDRADRTRRGRRAPP